MPNSFHKTEQLFPLKEMANYLPKRGGKKTHYSTLYRWATKGTRGRVLESKMVGGVRFTSKQALERFIATHLLSSGTESSDFCDAINKSLEQAGI